MTLTSDEEQTRVRLLINPTSEALDAAQADHDLHPLIRSDLGGPRRHPRFTRYDRHAWMSIWDITVDADPDGAESEIVLVFTHEDLLVVQRGPAEALRDLRPLLADPEEPAIASIERVLAAVTAEFVALGADIEDDLDSVEAEVFDTRAREDHRRIYRLRKRIGRIDRAASGLAEVMRDARGEIDIATAPHARLRAHFRHLHDDANGVAKLSANQHADLDAVVSSHESNVAKRQNQDMRTISAVAALLALPTVIASFYGMNFSDLPLLGVDGGWLVVVLVMVVLDIVAIVVFRMRGWLGPGHDEKGDSRGG